MGRLLRRVLAGPGVLIILVLALAALSNLLLPAASALPERLSEGEKVRVSELRHLQSAVGDVLWPGWGRAYIPLILYHEQYAFLIGWPDPPAGWVKVAANSPKGGPWQLVADGEVADQPYCRQRLPASGETPQAFAVRVGARWAAIVTTREWPNIEPGNEISRNLPSLLAPLLPYRLAGRVMAGNSDRYVTKVLHEAFHAYQGMTAPGRLGAAENAAHRQEQHYPENDAALRESWRQELSALAAAAKADSAEQERQSARTCLAQRQARRAAAGRSPELQDYARQREWLEGLAKYSELMIRRPAAATPTYSPLPAVLGDSDVKRYSTFGERWSQELDQAPRMAGDEGAGRCYYSGMLQATRLDRLAPDWKSRILRQGGWLEEILQQAVDQTRQRLQPSAAIVAIRSEMRVVA